MKRRILGKLILGWAIASWASFSALATVELTFTWTGSYYGTGFNSDWYNGVPDSSTARSLLAPNEAIGIYAFKVSDDGGMGLTTPFHSVCLSPAGVLDAKPHTYNVIPFSAANPGTYPSAWAWNHNAAAPQYWGIQNAAFLWNTYGMNIVNHGTDKNDQAAALELAIWTALYNSTGYGALAGNVWSPPTAEMGSGAGSVKAYYDSYIADLTDGGAIPLYTGNILRGTSYNQLGQQQDLLMLGTPIPEPTTIIAGALLLLPFGASTVRAWRRRG